MVFTPDGYNDLSNYLSHQTKVETDGYFLKMSCSVNREVIKLSLQYLISKIAVSKENIINRNTTMISEGGPYKRKEALISIDGKIVIKEDMSQKNRLVFDPVHPDAIKQGKKKGYVEYPAIMLNDELNLLEESVVLFNEFTTIYNRIEPNSVIEKIVFQDLLISLGLLSK